MKYIKWILIILFNIFIAHYGYAQSIISTKTVVLKYQDRTDTLNIPVASARYPALKEGLSYKLIFDGDDLPAIIANYDTCGCGTTGLDYKVTFENKDIVSIQLTFETMGAYPDSYDKWLTLNIHTGKAYPISNEINAMGLKWIFSNYKAILNRRIIADKKQNKDEDMNEYNALKDAIHDLTSGELFSKYVFTKQGVVFSMDQILPHVASSFDPNRDLLVPYAKLRMYKAPKAIIVK